MSHLSELPAWKALQAHYEAVESLHMRDLFDADDQRFEKLSVRLDDILLDFSKNRITEETVQLLTQLAREAGVEEWRSKMFSGDAINMTEQRSVLHTALRNRSNTPVMVDGEDVMPAVNRVLEQIRGFTERVRSGEWKGYTGKTITDIVNIGIGGSDLGPRMACDALTPFGHEALTMHFVSNVDPTHISEALKVVDPETTLFIVAPKTFTTQETMMNAHAARKWFIEKTGDESAIASHFVAVSTNIPAVKAFGILEENTFEFWNWVGGRYSMWSAIGLPIAVYIGMDQFEELLEGAHAMDKHFCEAPLEQNIPVILALLGVWYNNFHGLPSYAVIPYDQYLGRLPSFLQQLDMESNGKTIDRDNQRVDYLTGPIIWGETGSNCQHAFFQHLHQGTVAVPTDFLVPANSMNPLDGQHRVLLSNYLAQTRALMRGKNDAEVVAELKSKGMSDDEIASLTPHKRFEGNKPTNSILFDKLNPRTLGALIAMYEQKVFVQGIVWNINSFDQWGVELGKVLANEILDSLMQEGFPADYDSSSLGLIDYCYKLRNR